MAEGGSRSGVFLSLSLSLSLSEGALWGNLKGGLLYCETWRICRKGSGDGHFSP